MSSYSMREEGATANQVQRDTGAVTLYRRGFQGTNRALNRTERQEETKRLEEEYEERLEKVHESMARKYLALMRNQLQEFNLSNHPVVIRSSMGMTFLEVSGDPVGELPAGFGGAVDRLQEIDQFLENSWEWSSYLDGECLNLQVRTEPMIGNMARVTEKVPGKSFFMTVYPGTASGYYSFTESSNTAAPLTELEPDASERVICNQHYRSFAKRLGHNAE